MDSETSERIGKVEDRLAFVETNVAAIRERYATNDALAALRTAMIERFGKVDASLTRIDGEIATLRVEMNSRFANLELKIDAEIAKVRGEMSQLGMTILRWMAVTQLVTIGAVGGLIKYLH